MWITDRVSISSLEMFDTPEPLLCRAPPPSTSAAPFSLVPSVLDSGWRVLPLQADRLLFGVKTNKFAIKHTVCCLPGNLQVHFGDLFRSSHEMTLDLAGMRQRICIVKMQTLSVFRTGRSLSASASSAFLAHFLLVIDSSVWFGPVGLLSWQFGPHICYLKSPNHIYFELFAAAAAFAKKRGFKFFQRPA